MSTEDDQEFGRAIASVAELRKSDRSVGIDATPSFQPMVERLSLAEFRNYILKRYQGDRGKSAYEKYDLVDIPTKDLRSFDRVFYRRDFLRIVFIYEDDWNTVIRFKATLLNDQF